MTIIIRGTEMHNWEPGDKLCCIASQLTNMFDREFTLEGLTVSSIGIGYIRLVEFPDQVFSPCHFKLIPKTHSRWITVHPSIGFTTKKECQIQWKDTAQRLELVFDSANRLLHTIIHDAI